MASGSDGGSNDNLNHGLSNGTGGLSPLPICLFAHGWAYSLDFFTPLLLDLNTEHPMLMQQFKTLGLEQGYFERPAGVYEWTGAQWEQTSPIDEKIFPESTQAIGIGHSLGFAKLLELPCSWASLVSLHGFARFTAQERGQTGTPRRVVERMLNRFTTNPDVVLQDFWTRAEEQKSANPTHSINLERLHGDLQCMLELDLSSNLSMKLTSNLPSNLSSNFTANLSNMPTSQLVALWSQQDQIVGPELSAQTFPASCMQQAIAPHSGPLITPKVYTSILACALGNSLNKP